LGDGATTENDPCACLGKMTSGRAAYASSSTSDDSNTILYAHFCWYVFLVDGFLLCRFLSLLYLMSGRSGIVREEKRGEYNLRE